ncbi:MAG TPA: hypothetical protein VEC37_04725, partial [Bacillota bacterium]|nr:hypothetical protein [Bacillota bacterium]
MIIVIRFKYVLLALISLTLFITVLSGRLVTVNANSDGSITITLISFLPLRTQSLPGRLTVTSPDPRQRFQVRLAASRFTVVLQIREKHYPKGYPLTIRLKSLPTWVIGINRSFQRTVLPQIRPEILETPPGVSGTRNPLELSFTTPVRPETIGQQVIAGFPAKLEPRTYRSGQRIFTDYATWRITPIQPLHHCTQYRILINPQLTGFSGIAFGKRQVLRFTTVSQLSVVDRNPDPGSDSVSLASPVEAAANRKLRGGRVNVAGLSGETATSGQRLSFQPSQAWLPDTEYRAAVELVDQFGEQAGAVWKFRTQKLPGPVWIAIN